MENAKQSLQETLANASASAAAQEANNKAGAITQERQTTPDDKFAKRRSPKNLLAELVKLQEDARTRSQEAIDVEVIAIEVNNGMISDLKNGIKNSQEEISDHQAIVDAANAFLNQANKA